MIPQTKEASIALTGDPYSAVAIFSSIFIYSQLIIPEYPLFLRIQTIPGLITFLLTSHYIFTVAMPYLAYRFDTLSRIMYSKIIRVHPCNPWLKFLHYIFFSLLPKILSSSLAFNTFPVDTTLLSTTSAGVPITP